MNIIVNWDIGIPSTPTHFPSCDAIKLLFFTSVMCHIVLYEKMAMKTSRHLVIEMTNVGY